MKNEIPELIPDKAFKILKQKQLLHEVNLRNFIIKRDYKAMTQKITPDKAIDKLKKRYPKLSYSTIIEYTR